MLSDGELATYLHDGWVLLAGFFAEELDVLLAELTRVFPSPDEYWSSPADFPSLRGGQFDSVRTIPTGQPGLDRLPFVPRLRAIAEQVTEASGLRLLRGGYQAKFSGAADFDQVLHLDYTNHSLAVPPDGHASSLVGFIVYLTDVAADTGPTMVVSRRHTAHLDITETHLDRARRPEVYARERPVLCRAGALLAYDYRTYHRGTALRDPRGHRLNLSFAYGVATPWHGFYSWPNRADEASVRQLVAALDPGERALLGFPQPGDPYWTERTLDAVARRYPGFDAQPYREFLGPAVPPSTSVSRASIAPARRA
jgi:hypothetical protein